MRGAKLVFFLIRKDVEDTADSFVKIQFSQGLITGAVKKQTGFQE